MRAATLSAENEALRSHVSQLQEQVALLCEDLQVSGYALEWLCSGDGTAESSMHRMGIQRHDRDRPLRAQLVP